MQYISEFIPWKRFFRKGSKIEKGCGLYQAASFFVSEVSLSQNYTHLWERGEQ